MLGVPTLVVLTLHLHLQLLFFTFVLAASLRLNPFSKVALRKNQGKSISQWCLPEKSEQKLTFPKVFIGYPFAKVGLPLLQGYVEQSCALKDFASSLHRFSFFKESMILSSTKLYLLDMVLVTSMISLGLTPFTLEPST